MARKINTGKRGGSLLSDGVYLLRIMDAEDKVANSGNEMLQLQLAPLRNGTPFGRMMFDNLVYGELTQWKFDQLFDALEAPEDTNVSIGWFKNKEVYARVITDEYNGNVKNVVKTYLPPDIAEDILEKQATSSDSASASSFVDDDEDEEEEPAPRTRRRRQRPAELDEEEEMPL